MLARGNTFIVGISSADMSTAGHCCLQIMTKKYGRMPPPDDCPEVPTGGSC